MSEKIIEGLKIDVHTVLDMVSIRIHVGDEYKANVLHDDLVDRLKRGEGVEIRQEKKT